MKSTRATTRRRFFRQAGAALSVPLVATGEARESRNPAAPEPADELALRGLNAAFVHAVNAGDARSLAALDVDPAAVFGGRTPERLGADPEAGPEEIVIAPDRRTATARLRLIAEAREPIGPRCTLVDMARAQGEGFVRRVEPCTLALGYVRQGGVWKIERLTSVPAGRA